MGNIVSSALKKYSFVVREAEISLQNLELIQTYFAKI